MDAIALGPLLISLPRLYAFLAALLLLIASLLLLRLPKGHQARWFNGLVIAWLLAARLGHVIVHWSVYEQAPLDALKFWQPGYDPLWGLIAALLWSAWTLRRQALKLLGAAVLVAASSALWFALVLTNPLGSDTGLERLPELTLENLDGEPVELASLTGKPVILNLWATWCPPCRREMPLLAEVDERDDVTVVVVNQGEELLQIIRFLDGEELAFRHPLLDPRQQLMVLSESPGLPTTLFFDAQGALLERHIGELTRAQLNAWLSP